MQTCEILYALDKTSMVNHSLQFYAETNDANGRRRVAESKKFRGTLEPHDRNALDALNKIVAQLENAGWVESGRGAQWYNLRFSKSVDKLTG